MNVCKISCYLMGSYNQHWIDKLIVITARKSVIWWKSITLAVFHFSYLPFAWSGYNVDRCLKSVYSKIVNNANYSHIWVVEFWNNSNTGSCIFTVQFLMKNSFMCPYLICSKSGKKFTVDCRLCSEKKDRRHLKPFFLSPSSLNPYKCKHFET